MKFISRWFALFLAAASVTSAQLVVVTYNDGDALNVARSTDDGLELTIASGTATEAGIISGSSGGFIKTGAGTLILSGANTYTGSMILSHGTLEITGSNALSYSVVIAEGSTENATLRINGGSVSNHSAYVGGDPGSTGRAEISSGTWDIDTALYVGLSDYASMQISGGTVSSAQAMIGFGNTATGLMEVSGGTWTNGGNILLGGYLGSNGGDGTLTISGTGTVSAPELHLASAVNSTATVNLDGGTLITGQISKGSGTGTFTFNGGTLQLSGDQAALFSGFAAGNITLAAGGGTIDTQGYVVGLSQALSGPGGLITSGTGQLTLTGTNTYTGTTVVGSGQTLQLGAGGTTGSVAGLIDLSAPNATLVSNRSDDVTLSFSNILISTLQYSPSRTPSVIAQTGTGTLTLEDHIVGSNENYFDLTLRVTAGTLALRDVVSANPYEIEKTTFSLDMSGGTLDLGGQHIIMDTPNPLAGNIINGTIELAGTFSSGVVSADLIGNVTKIDAGTLTLSGVGSGTRISQFGSSTTTYQPSITVEAGTLQLGNSGTVISDVANVTINGGTFALGAANETIGTLAGSGGVVELFNGSGRTLTTGISSEYAAEIVRRVGNTIRGNSTYSGIIQGDGGALVKTGIGTLTLTGVNTYSGGTSLNGGAIEIFADSGLGAASGIVNFNGGTLTASASFTSDRATFLGAAGGTFNTAGNLTWNGDISGPGNLTKIGAGTLILGGTNTYSGTTFVNAGTLRLNSSGAFSPLTSMVVANGATFDANGFSQTFASLSGSGNVDINGGVLTVGPTGTDTSIYSGVLSGSGTLVKAGTGTLVLTGANTFTATTVLGAGTLQLDNSLALQNSTLNYYNQGGSLTFGSLVSAVTLGGLTGDKALSLTHAAAPLVLTVGNNDTDTTYAGALSGSGSFTKSGTGSLTLSGNNTHTGGTSVSGGTLILTGANTYTGGTTISAGTLQIGNGGTSGSVAGDIANAAALVFNRSNALIYDGVISGGGSLSQSGTGTLILTGENTYTGGTTISTGTLQIGDGGTSGSLAGSIINGSALIFKRSDDYLYSGAISGGGSLTKAGTGTLTLTGTNTYTGNTILNEGNLAVSAASALGAATSTFVFDGGTLATTASFATTHATTLLGGGATFDTADGTSLEWNGDISGTGNLTKLGLGTLLLGGTNTYVGTTFVNAGTLRLTGSNAFSNDTVIEVADGAVFDTNGFSQSFADISGSGNLAINGGTLRVGNNGTPPSIYSGEISGDGTLTKAGTGTLVLAGANSFSGTTTITGGILQLGDSLALQNSTLSYTNQGGALSFGTLTAATLGGLKGNQSLALTNDTPAGVALTVGSNNADSLYSGVLSGDGSLTKIGTGILTLSGANTYTGGTFISDGTLDLSGDNRLASTGALTLTGGLIQFNGHAQTVSSFAGTGGTLQNGILTTTQAGDTTFSGNLDHSQLILSGTGTLILDGDGDNGWSSAVVNAGTLVLAKNSNDYAHAVGGDFGATVLTINSGGTVRIAGTGGQQIFFATNVVNNTGGTLDLNGRDESFAGLTGGGTVTNSAASTTSTLVLGRIDTNATFSGKLQDGAGTVALTKVENGTLTLTGANTYTGATTVSAGTLIVNGSLATTAVTVAFGATLGGSGTIGGLTTIYGSLSPGNSPGVITFSAGLTLDSGSTTTMQIGGLARGAQYDGIDVTGGTLTFDGTLEVTFYNDFNVVGGESFDLFNWVSASGTFKTPLNLPSLADGLAWDTSALYTTGILSVSGGSIPEPATTAALAGLGVLALAALRRRRTE